MRRLRQRSVCDVATGLSDAEFDRVEAEFGFVFAPDHRAFLAAGLPVNTRPEPAIPGVISAHQEPWPDWRNGKPAKLREALAWPVEGVLFDVKSNGYWHDDWGPRPKSKSEAGRTAKARLAEVPALVPVYGHRYLPAGPGHAGHPVLSVWQTDIIYYGLDLADWIGHEFGSATWGDTEPEATVPFWRDLL
ncbi:hypothetical protein [Actinoplanes sp. L3-i22]|uniref:hypothetical protein n=1 Tax=Actinoplanes sp. L3-i22 TaxID=2836373 RepID=UPI001C77D5FB|nr:hypothetical protein L3i22_081660 [Actinoplanes sp. L3-i22]